MIPAEFDYHVAADLDEVLVALHNRPDARILAGGQSLIPILKTRRLSPGMLVDISKLSGLRGIVVTDTDVTIGALTTHRDIEESDDLCRRLPIMRETAEVLADPPVRNRGTFGGSLAFADPGGDWPAVVLALDARIHTVGMDGARTIPIDNFFVGRSTTALEHAEIVTRITLSIPQGRSGMAYRKLRHPSSGYALVGVAAVVVVDDSGRYRHCRIAVTGAGGHAMRAEGPERALIGHEMSERVLVDASAHAAEGMTLDGDVYAGERYRQRLVTTYVKRALRAANERIDRSR